MSKKQNVKKKTSYRKPKDVNNVGNGQFDPRKCTSNDPSYYNKHSAMYNSATQIPWVSIMGDTDPFGDIGFNSSFSDSPESIPGIMAVETVVSPGICADPSAPFNKALVQMVAEMKRMTTGGDLGFEAPDLGYYIMGMTSLTAVIAHIDKAMRASKFWRTRNINYPRAVLAAMGLDYDEVIANYTHYQSRLNSIILQYNTMGIPVFFDNIKRVWSMFNNIYLDEDSDLAQMYIFCPANWWNYVYDTDNVYLKNLPFPNISTSIDAWLTIAETIQSDWLKSTDYFVINGAINRAYKNTDFMKIQMIDHAADLIPIHDKYICSQIMNATVMLSTGSDITQDPVGLTLNYTVSRPTEVSSYRYVVPAGDWILRAYDQTENITKDDIMEMTRLTCTYSNMGGSLELHMAPPEFVKEVRIYAYVPHDNTVWGYGITNFNVPSYSGGLTINRSLDINANTFKNMFKVCAFRYAPTIICGVYDTDDDEYTYGGIMGDVYNYTPISQPQLQQLHTTALLSEFTVLPANNYK